MADADPLHRGGEIIWARKHVGRGFRCVRKRIDIEEHGAGDMRRVELAAAIAPARGHVPAGVEDPEIRLSQSLGEPFGRDQRVDVRRIGVARLSC